MQMIACSKKDVDAASSNYGLVRRRPCPRMECQEEHDGCMRNKFFFASECPLTSIVLPEYKRQACFPKFIHSRLPLCPQNLLSETFLEDFRHLLAASPLLQKLALGPPPTRKRVFLTGIYELALLCGQFHRGPQFKCLTCNCSAYSLDILQTVATFRLTTSRMPYVMITVSQVPLGM